MMWGRDETPIRIEMGLYAKPYEGFAENCTTKRRSKQMCLNVWRLVTPYHEMLLAANAFERRASGRTISWNAVRGQMRLNGERSADSYHETPFGANAFEWRSHQALRPIYTKNPE